MYRTYENPWALEARAKQAQEELNNAIYEGYSEQAIADLYNEAEELRQMANQAWQDDEASELGLDY